jgi:hypothetical protein
MDRIHANAGLGEMEEHFRALLFQALRHENVEQAEKIANGLAQAQAIKPNSDIEFWSGTSAADRANDMNVIVGGDRLAITADSQATDNWLNLVEQIEYVAK